MGPLIWTFFHIFGIAFASDRVRHVECHPDQIVTVRTAIGIATIIQVPDHPNSVVVGDQDAFKVEYLDQAITIKPLHGGAKSNLYVYTDWQRYNVALVTGSEPSADYVVYLDHLKLKATETKTTIHWHEYVRSMKSDVFSVTTKRLATTSDLAFLEFEVSASEKAKIDPGWFWVVQSKTTKPIHNLLLSSLEIGPNEKVTGVIQLKRADILDTAPILLELKRKKTTSILLPKVTLWK